MAENQNYDFNKGKLAANKFAILPLGSIKVKGWLNNQLLMLSNGLTEEMEKYPDYSENSAWLGGNGEDWERGPYYMRGLVAQAYQLGDKRLIKKAQKWIDFAIESQDDDGFFGPVSNTDWWPRMPVLMAVRDYYEATGESDGRVLPFMEKYFRYQLKMLPENPLYSWAHARGGDNMDSVYWLYNKLYDSSAPEETDWLLELGELIKSQTQDWTEIFTNSTVREHVVNTSQALKMPIVYYQSSHNIADKNAFKIGLDNIRLDHGRVDELPNSDEAARDNKPTRGTELCGITEGMLSTEIAMRILGEGWLGDRLETLAFNALPAAYAPDYLGHVYYITQNQALATRGKREFDCDHGDDAAFGAPGGFDCCFANNHMGWPKLFQSMWMATADGGLAVVCYGSNEVTAKVADSKTAVFKQITDYPFDDKICIDYSGDNAHFGLMLRIPAWCDSPAIRINSENVAIDSVQNGYFTVCRDWKAGDKIELELPAKIQISTWYNGFASVKRGALLYALKIEENWIEAPGDRSCREITSPLYGRCKCWEAFPDSRWNYGLVTDSENPESSFEISRNEITDHPFIFDQAPIELTATGQIIPGWKLDGNLTGELPFGEISSDKSLQEKITLIPYGCGRLKISQFPKIGENGDKVVRNDFIRTERGCKLENIAVPPASEYSAVIKTKTNGELSVVVNGRVQKNVSVNNKIGRVEGLKSLIEQKHMSFCADNLNTLEFDCSCGEIESVHIIPEEYEFTIKTGSCFEAIWVEYPIISDATHYALYCASSENELVFDNIIPNGYKSGDIFISDRFSATVDIPGEYEVYMTAFRDKTRICSSDKTKIRIGG